MKYTRYNTRIVIGKSPTFARFIVSSPLDVYIGAIFRFSVTTHYSQMQIIKSISYPETELIHILIETYNDDISAKQ